MTLQFNNTGGSVSATIGGVSLSYTNPTQFNFLAISGAVDLNLNNFITLSGGFGFEKVDSGTTTEIHVAAQNVVATMSVGSFSVGLTGGSLALLLKADGTKALDASGGLVLGGAGFASATASYLSVSDMNQAINYVKASGGSIYREPFELPNRGSVAFVFDSQNAILSFVKSSSGDPADSDPIYNEWFWTELWTNNVDNSVKFYTELFGYNSKKFDTRADNQYHVKERENRPRAGIIKTPFENVKPHWMPYIAVKDPSEIVKKVEQLGGTVYLSTEGIAGNNAAIIADPSGSVFTVQKWPLEKGEFLKR